MKRWIVLGLLSLTVGCSSLQKKLPDWLGDLIPTPQPTARLEVVRARALSLPLVHVGEPQLTIGSSGLNPVGKTSKSTDVTPATWTASLAPGSTWMPSLTVTKMGSQSLASFAVNHTCVRDGASTKVQFDAPGFAPGFITFQVKCSSSSTPPCGSAIGTAVCAAAPPTLPSPSALPTGTLATRTAGGATPSPDGGKPTPTRTTQPTARPTVPVTGFRLPPLRPTTTDVRYEVNDAGYPRRWCPLRDPAGGTFLCYVPATQTCMDAISEMNLNQMVKAVRVLRQLPQSDNATDFCLSDSQGVSAITAFLNPVYEGNFGEYRGDWAEDEDKCGKDYCKPHYCQKKARAFLLSNDVACAELTNAVETLDWLGLQVVGGRCVERVRPTTFPTTKADPQYASMGTINYDVRQPALTPEQLHLLHETHRCHAEASAAKCGGPPATCSAGQAHLDFEASARNETEHHFFVMKRFFNDPDPRLTPAEQCIRARLEDYDHMRWMILVEQGDWKSRKAENDHQFDHLCMLLKDDRMLGRRTDCGDPNVNHCPIETCAQIMARAEAIMRQPIN